MQLLGSVNTQIKTRSHLHSIPPELSRERQFLTLSVDCFFLPILVYHLLVLITLVAESVTQTGFTWQVSFNASQVLKNQSQDSNNVAKTTVMEKYLLKV